MSVKKGEKMEEMTSEYFLNEVQVDVRVNSAFKIGKGRTAIEVRLRTWKYKRLIMGKRHLLTEKKVYINYDFTPKDRVI